MATKLPESTSPDSHPVQTQSQESPNDPAKNNTAQEQVPPSSADKNDAARPIYIYTRPQLLIILQSPLVKPPANMPNLMQWLGSADSGSADNRKDADASVQTGSRDRRFRRDNDDNDAPLRSTFRPSLTQPSQMGNFKHQSMRTTERERDRDRESEKDKEGHERLRNLSDKFDRERLSHPSNGARSRDSAPHLSSNSARIGTKKKAGESSEDWRRGAEPPRPGREDKHEDREGARSRPRDASKGRRETSPSRKDRDDGDRDRYRRVDKDRDDYRKEREAYRRDRDDDQDDPRKWRDDGRREERLAQARRERERDPNWDDRRWTLVEERDSRNKRSSGRERRQQDEPKDREEKKDREKDKEPAWMDSTALLTPGSGIIGGQSADGGLDQIQAWKRSLKEREQKEKEKTSDKNATSQTDTETSEPVVTTSDTPKHLDEIQLFKLIMKREGEKKSTDSPSDSPSLTPVVPSSVAAPATESLGTTAKPSATDPRDLLSMLSGASISGNSPLTPAESTKTIPPSARNTDSSAQSTPQIPQFQPPAGSRLLAMRNPSSQSVLSSSKTASGGFSPTIGGVPTSHSPVHQMVSPGIHNQTLSRQASQKGDPNVIRQNFSPFEEQNRAAFGFDSPQQQQILHDSLHRQHSGSFAPEGSPDMLAIDQGNFENRNGGSRFAKFFDNKPREVINGGVKGQNTGFVNNIPPPHQRHDPGSSPALGGDQRTMEDLYAMLQSSAQNRLPANVPMRHANNVNLQLLQQQQLQQQLLQQQQNNVNRLEALYDSRLDDRNFVPDGMVPGLRTAPPPRRRHDGIDIMDDSLHFNNRHPNVQQRNVDQMYNGSAMGPYGQQLNNGRSPSMPLQQQQFRGGSSPINHNALHNPQQRLPPGLANLGGRPPHEPSQLGGMHGALPANGPQQFTNYSPNANGLNNFGNSPNLRGHLNPQQLELLNQLGHPANIGQHQGLPGNLRGNANYNSPSIQQQGGQNMFTLRQQQQSMLPPHMHPQHTPQAQHQPPPQGFNNPNNQGAHDLMALLMGGQLQRE